MGKGVFKVIIMVGAHGQWSAWLLSNRVKLKNLTFGCPVSNRIANPCGMPPAPMSYPRLCKRSYDDKAILENTNHIMALEGGAT